MCVPLSKKAGSPLSACVQSARHHLLEHSLFRTLFPVIYTARKLHCNCTVLHCTELPCTALHSTAVYCSVLHRTALCTALHRELIECSATNNCDRGQGDKLRSAPLENTLHCTALYCTALNCTVLHCTALYCTALQYTALHGTALNCTKVLYFCYQ